jgi:lipoprotein-anchoring transpeptidase ErfK/SrfK
MLTTLKTRPWSLIVIVAAVAIVAWGSYAWKFAGGESPEAGNPEKSVADAGELSDPITALRATRPAGPDDRADLSSSVRPNAPASIGDSVEITLQPDAAVQPAPDDPGQRDEPVEVADAAPTAPTDAEAGRVALERGEQAAGRALLSRSLAGRAADPAAMAVRSELSQLAEAMLFSRAVIPNDPLTGTHIVASGESLYVIAKRNRITETLLASINQIDKPSQLRAGARLKILHGPFRAVIYKTLHRLDVYLGDVYVRSFRVGLGTNGGTPLGDWRVGAKLSNPDWTDPTDNTHYGADDPANPIGEHWIGLECVAGDCLGRSGFGIHGTIDPASIGENMSMGCVRLVPEDVSALFDLLVRKHSPVEILP